VLMVIAEKEFWPAYRVVPIIVLANVIFTFNYHFNMGIIIEKKTKYFAYINASNAALNLTMNFLLIPLYGIYGAAFATLISYTYLTVLTYYFSSKFFKIDFEFLRMGKILAAALLIYIISRQVALDSLWADIFSKLLIITSFPLVLYFMKFYTTAEKTVISTLMRPDIGMLKQ